ncbi:MAG TPA: nucleotidyltransferase family protein [Planctomycetaceae bacterium]
MSTVTPAADKTDVFERLAKLAPALADLGVRRIGLFGSFVRGEQQADSDVDLLVSFQRGRKTFRNFMEAADLLEGALGRKVDIVTPESLSPFIGPSILREVEYDAAVDELPAAHHR